MTPLIDTERCIRSRIVMVLKTLPERRPLSLSILEQRRRGLGNDAGEDGFLDVAQLRTDLLELLLQAASFIVRLTPDAFQVAVDAID
jgi:hypothetical protein